MGTLGIREQIAAAVGFLAQQGVEQPAAGLILGSGLDQLAEQVTAKVTIPYGEIPHFPVSTVAHHPGELIYGIFNERPVLVMRGRAHYYEGYSMRQITFPVRVMKALGVELLVLTSAVGGLHPLYREGDLAVVVDHINLMGDNPLIGPNDDAIGPRFPDMSEPYSHRLIELAVGAALNEGIALHRSVLVAVAGPNLETRAEYRFLRMIGADLVGMSMVPENLAAVHAGLPVLGLCAVTDTCLPDALGVADIARIIQNAAVAQPGLNRIIERVLCNAGE
ncbi:MAG: purine-nucleoside phosphorylase [Candidatus Eisenbacteria sp.]|nr:purine-nucleoside phosphorylase [Candidatus Eisenbacteria bacterium]